MAAAWSWKRRHWAAFLVLYALATCQLLSPFHHQAHAFFHVERSESSTTDHGNDHYLSQAQRPQLKQDTHDYHLSHLEPASCVCLQQDNPPRLHQEQHCPVWPYPLCLHDSVEGRFALGDSVQAITSGQFNGGEGDHVVVAAAASVNNGEHAAGHADATESAGAEALREDVGPEDNGRRTSTTNQPASSPTIAGSTVIVYSRDPEAATDTHDPKSTVTVAVVGENHEPISSETTYFSEALKDSSTAMPLQPTPSSKSTTHHTQQPKTVSPSAAATAPTPTDPPQIERHIPSYEQWRKQVLEKKKPADASERKQRKRKPYQESSVDVAIGGEDEIGFVFPNLDNGSGNGKGGDDRSQQLSDQLGNGPDLKQGLGQDREWIKSEYSKDPKDRFNHASATCAASIVKASKDATSIMAILNEGKDNYMLNKCTTRDKFFVVELCEEILVDTFVLGNYEFFSSTFKDFVVSVNRYPPRDDGWSILGHFQARNTRDAQLFKPATPQLATYIRFDFQSHYGNEFYCPVTLLRVYGATALEQLKQEEEEEKRLAEEEKRLAELERVREAEADADDAEEVEEVEEIEEAESLGANDPTGDVVKANMTKNLDVIDVDKDDPEGELQLPQAPQNQAEPGPLPIHSEPNSLAERVTGESAPVQHDRDTESDQKDSPEGPNDVQEQHEAGPPTFIVPEGSRPESLEATEKDDSLASHVPSPETTLKSFEQTITATEDYAPTDVLPPRASTSPASMQDDGDWQKADLGMITLSAKSKPTPIPKPSVIPKPPSGGVGTTVGGASSATDSSSHSSPSPQHSSQESVYKNIVNRLKVLELNSSLSYQYLEEQSNIFNEVIESSEQKINQLVSHLNEATRRLETLGRKYDQLAYSFRAHVEVDGEKRRLEFINLSSQVHVLGSQVVFQRHLFVVGAITIFSIIAFIAITGSNTMHYAIQQLPLGAKLRAISGHRRDARSNDITSSVRIGSVEALTQFDQNSLLMRHSGSNIKLTPPISPMTPLTLDVSHTAQPRLDSSEQEVMESPRGDSTTSQLPIRESTDGQEGYSGNSRLPLSRLELSSNQIRHQQEAESSDDKELRNPQSDSSLLVSRTPYPTPKSSFGPGRLFLHPNHSNSSQSQLSYPNDYRPDSPVFQGPSSVHDEGQLSDADVAYMSRDMNVGRKSSSSPGSIPTSPAMRRLSTGFHNQNGHHSGISRPLSSLRMDATASLAALARSESSDSPEALHLSPEDDAQSNTIENNTGSYEASTAGERDRPYEDETGGALANNDLIKTPEMAHNALMEEEDVGFVSDSVLDSTSESMAGTRELLQVSTGSLGDWDRQHGLGEILPRHEDLDDEVGEHAPPAVVESIGNSEDEGRNNDILAPAVNETVKEQLPRLIRDQLSKSKRRSSYNILRSQDFSSNTPSSPYKINSVSTSTSFGLGLELGSEPYSSSSQDTLLQPSPVPPSPSLERRGTAGALSGTASRAESGGDDDGVDADDDSAAVPQGLSERRKLYRKPSLPEDQAVPRRHVSYGRRETMEADLVGAEVDEEDLGREGDDERSPLVSRKA